MNNMTMCICGHIHLADTKKKGSGEGNMHLPPCVLVLHLIGRKLALTNKTHDDDTIISTDDETFY